MNPPQQAAAWSATCPHCRENTIGPHAKSWSSAAHPAKCSKCGGLSYIQNTHGTAAGRAAVLVPCLAIIAALITASVWPLVLGVCAFLALVAYEAVVFYRLPMIATADLAVGEARHWERIGLAIIFVIIVGILVAYGAARAV